MVMSVPGWESNRWGREVRGVNQSACWSLTEIPCHGARRGRHKIIGGFCNRYVSKHTTKMRETSLLDASGVSPRIGNKRCADIAV
ncbi:MAG: hypothetical protein NVSMB6_11940 [Burkholderiaceae bacterium]